MLQTAASLLRHHNRPELLARELVHLLTATDAVVEARALSLGAGEPQVLATATGVDEAGAESTERRIAVGFARDRSPWSSISQSVAISMRRRLSTPSLFY